MNTATIFVLLFVALMLAPKDRLAAIGRIGESVTLSIGTVVLGIAAIVGAFFLAKWSLGYLSAIKPLPGGIGAWGFVRIGVASWTLALLFVGLPLLVIRYVGKRFVAAVRAALATRRNSSAG